MLYLILSLNAVFAGDWRPLCNKVNASSAVVEVEYTIKGKYSDVRQRKGYPPKPTTLKAISETGRITKGLQGQFVVGDPWFGDVEFLPGGSSVSDWKRLFKRQSALNKSIS